MYLAAVCESSTTIRERVMQTHLFTTGLGTKDSSKKSLLR